MADYEHTDRDALDDGEIVDLLGHGVRVHIDGKPVTRATGALWNRLGRYVTGGSDAEQAAAYQALFGLVLDGTHDTAEDGDPAGYLLASPEHHALAHHPVWLQGNDDGWTAMLPSDY